MPSLFRWQTINIHRIKVLIIFRPYSVQFSRSFVSDSLRPHELQPLRPPCPSPTPGAYPNSCPLSRWCHLTISSSVIPFSCLQSFATSGSFQMSQLFTSGGQSIGVSPSASVLPFFCVNIQYLFFCFWLSSLCMTVCRSIHVSSYGTILFHFMAD